MTAAPDCISLDLFEGEARLWPTAFPPEEAAGLFAELRHTIDWQQESILMFGRRVLVPRLVAWHGDPGASYTYSGTLHQPLPWTRPLARIRDRAAELCGARFNAVLLNLYRDGRDGMGWHADDEAELGRDPVIASVSLGAHAPLLPAPPQTQDPEARRAAAARQPALHVGTDTASLAACATQVPG